ncbi:CopG family transcriptional regulator [Methylorubrum sp. Q1]|nr:CopG family transcriptional regulator [Methylorubrum sp. Q1]
MSNTPTRNVSLTAELTADIHVEVTSDYDLNASEVVRAGLRLRIARDHTRSTGCKRTRADDRSGHRAA